MTPEQLADDITAHLTIQWSSLSRTGIKKLILKHLADYDPVSELMLDERWNSDWSLVYRWTREAGGFFQIWSAANDGYDCKLIASGKTAIEACQLAVDSVEEKP